MVVYSRTHLNLYSFVDIDTKPQGVKAYKHTHNVADSDVDSTERSAHIHNFNEVEFRSTCEELSSTRVEKGLGVKALFTWSSPCCKKTSV